MSVSVVATGEAAKQKLRDKGEEPGKISSSITTRKKGSSLRVTTDTEGNIKSAESLSRTEAGFQKDVKEFDQVQKDRELSTGSSQAPSYTDQAGNTLSPYEVAAIQRTGGGQSIYEPNTFSQRGSERIVTSRRDQEKTTSLNITPTTQRESIRRGAAAIVKEQKQQVGVSQPNTISAATRKEARRSKIAEFKSQSGLRSFQEGFTFTPQEGSQNPFSGEASFSQSLGFATGVTLGFAAEGVGKLLGAGAKTVTFIQPALKGIGGVLTSKPVILGLTAVATKEVITSAKENGLEGVARTGFNLVKDVNLFSGFVKAAKIVPFKLNPFGSETVRIPTVEGDTTIRTFGLDIGKGRAQPLVTVRTDVRPGVPGVDPVTFEEVPTTTKSRSIEFGNKQFDNRVSVDTLANPLDQPETAVGGKALRQVIDFSSAEVSRLEALEGVSRSLGKDKGLNPDSVLFKVEGLKNPEGTTRRVIEFTNKLNGVLFGSVVSERLPAGFKNAKIGDVDIFAPDKSVSEITPELESLTSSLRRGGEDVVFNPDKASIEFRQGGGKLLEVKSGVDPETLGLDDVAPESFLGFKMNTEGVPFADTQSITAGQQLIRKASGSGIVSPPVSPGGAEFTSFESGGVVGKIIPSNPRGTKDIAGFVQTSRGLIELQGSSTPKGRTAQAQLDKFLDSFTPEQRADIETKVDLITGNDRVSFDSRVGGSPNTISAAPSSLSVFSRAAASNSPSYSRNFFSPVSASPSITSSSFSVSSSSSSPSPSSIISLSPSVSPSSSSRSPSPSSPSVGSPSPGSPSPGSPLPISPSIGSPSPGSPSPGSPSPGSPSPGSPSPGSPSPPPSPFKRSKQREAGTPGFNVEVRTKGIFKQVSTSPLSLKEAKALGSSIAGSSSAATFRVLPSGTEAKGFFRGRSQIQDFDFRPGGLYIEKREKRINTPGELFEITRKGQFAIKNKRGIFT